jgi:hypothetical protein
LQRKTPFRPTPRDKATPKPCRFRKPRKPGEAAAEEHARARVGERSQGVCEIQILGVCFGRATNFSHRYPEGQGGPWAASNGLHACGSGSTGCHGYIESHRTEAYANGWLLRTGSDPLTTPVVVWPTGLVFLDDDGGWRKPMPDEIPDHGNNSCLAE